MPEHRLQVAIIGLGPFSRTVCEALARSGHEVLGIDPRADVVQEVHEAGITTQVVQADPEHLQALRELDVAQFDVVVVGRGTDVEASLATVLNLLQLGAKRVVAKAANERHAQLLARVGGDKIEVVYPEHDMGIRLARRLMGQDVLEAVWIDPLHGFAEVPLPPALAGTTAGDAQAGPLAGLVLVAVRRSGELVIAPEPRWELRSGDRLVLLGRTERLTALGG